jgi:hypothetical protein
MPSLYRPENRKIIIISVGYFSISNIAEDAISISREGYSQSPGMMDFSVQLNSIKRSRLEKAERRGQPC